MNRSFARTISLLRREKGISQKAAAAELGVSQALLSHYENGIRECSLEFVVRLAEYYHVSTDYLLGRTTHRTENENEQNQQTENQSPQLFSGEEARTSGTLAVIFSVLRRIQNPQLAILATDVLDLTLYRVLRTLYTLNGRSGPKVSRLSDAQSDSTAAAVETLLLQRFRRTAALANGRGDALFEDKGYVLSPESLAEEFPQLADAVFDLSENAERQLNDWLRMG